MIEELQDITKLTDSNETVESTALAGAAAIQRLITDRNNLRTWASSQHRELTALRASNEDLRHRLLTIKQSYLELATRILEQFERFDGSLREALDDDGKPSEETEDPTLVNLARRLSPVGRPRS